MVRGTAVTRGATGPVTVHVTGVTFVPPVLEPLHWLTVTGFVVLAVGVHIVA